MAKRVEALIERWREYIETLKRCGAKEPAIALANYASELEAALREEEFEALTLSEAVAESGLSYSSLEKRLRSGALPNVGRKGSPRIRRGDLPRKGGKGSTEIVDVLAQRRLT